MTCGTVGEGGCDATVTGRGGRTAAYVQTVWPPAPGPSSSDWPQNTLSVSAEKQENSSGLKLISVWSHSLTRSGMAI